MAQEIEVGMLARLTESFTVSEVFDDHYVDKDDFVYFVRGTVVKVLHVFKKEGCDKQAVIYSDVLKEATSCAVDFLEPMKVIGVENYVSDGGKVKQGIKISF